MNILTRRGVRFWNVHRSEDEITAAMYMSDYRRVRPLARSACVRLKLNQKAGLPTVVRRYRDRLGIVLGAFAFVLTIFIMSQFVWSIDVSGLESVSESELRSLLQEEGLYVGANKRAFDCPSVSRAVMLKNRKIGWMAVNVTGSYASVEIKEEESAPEIPDLREPCNVKASRDGTIRTISAGEGEVLLKEGSGVIAGQLLVSGVMDDLMGGVRLVHAQAIVTASTAYHSDFCIPDCVQTVLPTGERGQRKRIVLFGLQLPFGACSVGGDNAVCDRYDCPAPLDVSLPVGVITEHVAGMERQELLLDDISAKEILQKHAQLYEIFQLSACTVSSRGVTLTHADGKYILSADYSCTEDIAVQEPIGTDENTDRRRIPSTKKED